MRRLLLLAPLLLATTLHAQTVVTPAGTFTAKAGSALTVEVGDGWVKITWGAVPNPTPNPTPTPPVPPAPDPTPTPPPGPVKTADWLILLMDPASMTPELADLRASATLRGQLAPTKVVSYMAGTPDYAKYQPFMTSKGLKPPLYLFMSGQTVLGSGAVTDEASILEAAANLR